MPLQVGGTVVQWMLHPEFCDPGPYTFQLQWAETGLPTTDDWVDVGAEVTDVYSAVDTEPRNFGQLQRSHYRLLLNTPTGSYASDAAPAYGELTQRWWGYARGLLRQEQTLLEKTLKGTRGFLLKRRWQGERCSCMNALVNETNNPQHELCYGTGIVGGYYPPVGCTWVERRTYEYRSHSKQTSPDNENFVMGARMLNVPQVFSGDVWVDKAKDERFFIHRFKIAAEVQGVPLILDPVEMRLEQFNHIIYRFPIPALQAV